ncbi:MAG: MATE family efflux transporter, partial [Bacilli bacterium]
MLAAWNDRKFLKTMIALALPITIQSFITSSLNLIDNVMVGTLGETAIASVGLANQYMFIFLLCVIGINA